ncbi:unnamed protein product, partial [Laminaria digitata]
MVRRLFAHTFFGDEHLEIDWDSSCSRYGVGMVSTTPGFVYWEGCLIAAFVVVCIKYTNEPSRKARARNVERDRRGVLLPFFGGGGGVGGVVVAFFWWRHFVLGGLLSEGLLRS